MSRIQQEVSKCPQQYTKSTEVNFGARVLIIIVIPEYLGCSVPQPGTLCIVLGGFASERDSIRRWERLLDERLELTQRIRCERRSVIQSLRGGDGKVLILVSDVINNVTAAKWLTNPV